MYSQVNPAASILPDETWTLRQSLMTGCSSIQHLQEVQKMEPELRRGVTTSGSMRSQICFLVGDKMIMQKKLKNSPQQTIQNTRYIYIYSWPKKKSPTIQQSTNRQNCSHGSLQEVVPLGRSFRCWCCGRGAALPSLRCCGGRAMVTWRFNVGSLRCFKCDFESILPLN